MREPFDLTQPSQLKRLDRRPEDNLPTHVKGDVEWKTDQYHGPGYYLYLHRKRTYLPLEFIEGYWYQLRVFTGQAFTSPEGRLPPNARGTGTWKPEDSNHPEHPNHQQYLEELESLATEQTTQELYEEAQCQAAEEAAATQPPTLTVETNVPSLAGDPTLSPFLAAQVHSSPSFTEPQAAPDQEESDSTDTSPSSHPTNEPSPKQEGQEEPVMRCSTGWTRTCEYQSS